MLIVIWELLEAISTLSGLTLILTGIASMSWLIVRMSDVLVSADPESWENILTWAGSIIGIFALITAAADMVIPYSETIATDWEPGVNNDFATISILLIVGVLLVLRPIKDIPFAAAIGLIIGIGLFSGIVYFLGVDNAVNQWVAILVIATIVAVYIALKIVEDLYKLLGGILTSPPVSIGLGVLAIIQGIFVLLNSSILLIF